jgi:hypothetical protein
VMRQVIDHLQHEMQIQTSNYCGEPAYQEESPNIVKGDSFYEVGFSFSFIFALQ